MTAGGLGELTETVLADARREAQALLEDARRRAEQTLADAEGRARSIEAQATAAGAAEGERARRSRVALAEIEVRQQRLRQRAALVQEVIDGALGRLAQALSGAEGEGFSVALVQRALRALGGGRVRVQLRQQDREGLRRLPTRPGTELLLGDDPALEAGVVVESADGRRVVRALLPDLARRREADLVAAVARALFGTGDGR